MGFERATEIIGAWQLLAEPREQPTPERVLALTGASWAEWTQAHKIVYPGMDPGDVDLGFA
jgi:hypothetical protein